MLTTETVKLLSFLEGEVLRVLQRKTELDPKDAKALSASIARAIVGSGKVSYNPEGSPNILTLDLPNRLTNQLIRNGIYYLDELCDYTEDELLDIDGLGRKYVEDIKRALSLVGLALRASR